MPLSHSSSDDVTGHIERSSIDVDLPRRSLGRSSTYDVRAHLTGTRVELACGHTPTWRGPDSDVDLRDGTPFIDLMPNEQAWIPLGYRAQIPDGIEPLLRPVPELSFRAGLVLECGTPVPNAETGGEWRVLLRNHSDIRTRVFHGDVIAELLFVRVVQPAFVDSSVA